MKRTSGNGAISPQWIYLMICFPALFLCKIGISNKVSRRACEVSEKVFGIAIPIFAVYVPFGFHTEQFMHRLFSIANVRYGQGREWFWLPVAPLAILIMSLVFAFWCAVVLFLFWLISGCPQEPVESLGRLISKMMQ